MELFYLILVRILSQLTEYQLNIRRGVALAPLENEQ